jgi:SAM-dependent methyltransferase
MMGWLRQWLTEPMVRHLDPDATDFTVTHREVLRRKPMLRWLFESFYRECREMDRRYFGDCPGLRLEIGSGSSFFQEVYHDVVTSDIKPVPFLQLAANAEALPLTDGSLRALYAINVFHHLPHPRLFFRELLRVLHPGGGAVLIEPYYGPVARFLFRRLHASEGFDPMVFGWERPQAGGPMSGANQALSYVVFVRDRMIFNEKFPELEVVVDRPHTHLLYFLSGGVNFRQLAPTKLTAAIAWTERCMKFLNPILAVQHTIVLRRR